MSREKCGCFTVRGKKFYVYEGINTIGRDKQAAVIIKDLGVSQQHALLIVVDETKHFISDFNSSNGTQINNEKLVPYKLYEISDGSVVYFSVDVEATYKKLSKTKLNDTTFDNTLTQNTQTTDDTIYAAQTQLFNETNFLTNTTQSTQKSNAGTSKADQPLSLFTIPEDRLTLNSPNTQSDNIHDLATQIVGDRPSTSKCTFPDDGFTFNSLNTQKLVSEAINDLPTQIEDVPTQNANKNLDMLIQAANNTTQPSSLSSIHDLPTQVTKDLNLSGIQDSPRNTNLSSIHESVIQISKDSDLPSIYDMPTQVSKNLNLSSNIHELPTQVTKHLNLSSNIHELPTQVTKDLNLSSVHDVPTQVTKNLNLSNIHELPTQVTKNVHELPTQVTRSMNLSNVHDLPSPAVNKNTDSLSSIHDSDTQIMSPSAMHDLSTQLASGRLSKDVHDASPLILNNGSSASIHDLETQLVDIHDLATQVIDTGNSSHRSCEMRNEDGDIHEMDTQEIPLLSSKPNNTEEVIIPSSADNRAVDVLMDLYENKNDNTTINNTSEQTSDNLTNTGRSTRSRRTTLKLDETVNKGAGPSTRSRKTTLTLDENMNNEAGPSTRSRKNAKVDESFNTEAGPSTRTRKQKASEDLESSRLGKQKGNESMRSTCSRKQTINEKLNQPSCSRIQIADSDTDSNHSGQQKLGDVRPNHSAKQTLDEDANSNRSRKTSSSVCDEDTETYDSNTTQPYVENVDGNSNDSENFLANCDNFDDADRQTQLQTHKLKRHVRNVIDSDDEEDNFDSDPQSQLPVHLLKKRAKGRLNSDDFKQTQKDKEGDVINEIEKDKAVNKIDKGKTLSTIDEDKEVNKIGKDKALSTIDEDEGINKIDKDKAVNKIDKDNTLGKIDEDETINEDKEVNKIGKDKALSKIDKDKAISKDTVESDSDTDVEEQTKRGGNKDVCDSDTDIEEPNNPNMSCGSKESKRGNINSALKRNSKMMAAESDSDTDIEDASILTSKNEKPVDSDSDTDVEIDRDSSKLESASKKIKSDSRKLPSVDNQIMSARKSNVEAESERSMKKLTTTKDNLDTTPSFIEDSFAEIDNSRPNPNQSSSTDIDDSFVKRRSILADCSSEFIPATQDANVSANNYSFTGRQLSTIADATEHNCSDSFRLGLTQDEENTDGIYVVRALEEGDDNSSESIDFAGTKSDKTVDDFDFEAPTQKVDKSELTEDCFKKPLLNRSSLKSSTRRANDSLDDSDLFGAATQAVDAGRSSDDDDDLFVAATQQIGNSNTRNKVLNNSEIFNMATQKVNDSKRVDNPQQDIFSAETQPFNDSDLFVAATQQLNDTNESDIFSAATQKVDASAKKKPERLDDSDILFGSATQKVDGHNVSAGRVSDDSLFVAPTQKVGETSARNLNTQDTVTVVDSQSFNFERECLNRSGHSETKKRVSFGKVHDLEVEKTNNSKVDKTVDLQVKNKANTVENNSGLESQLEVMFDTENVYLAEPTPEEEARPVNPLGRTFEECTTQDVLNVLDTWDEGDEGKQEEELSKEKQAESKLDQKESKQKQKKSREEQEKSKQKQRESKQKQEESKQTQEEYKQKQVESKIEQKSIQKQKESKQKQEECKQEQETKQKQKKSKQDLEESKQKQKELEQEESIQKQKESKKELESKQKQNQSKEEKHESKQMENESFKNKAHGVINKDSQKELRENSAVIKGRINNNELQTCDNNDTDEQNKKADTKKKNATIDATTKTPLRRTTRKRSKVLSDDEQETPIKSGRSNLRSKDKENSKMKESNICKTKDSSGKIKVLNNDEININIKESNSVAVISKLKILNSDEINKKIRESNDAAISSKTKVLNSDAGSSKINDTTKSNSDVGNGKANDATVSSNTNNDANKSKTNNDANNSKTSELNKTNSKITRLTKLATIRTEDLEEEDDENLIIEDPPVIVVPSTKRQSKIIEPTSSNQTAMEDTPSSSSSSVSFVAEHSVVSEDISRRRTTRVRKTKFESLEEENLAVKKRAPKKAEPAKKASEPKKGRKRKSSTSDEDSTITVSVPKNQKRMIICDEDINEVALNATTANASTSVAAPTAKRAKRKVAIKVIFTMLDSPLLQKMVRTLGGTVADSIENSTVLVTKSVLRTVKLLSAVGHGKPICSPDWLHESSKANTFLDPWDYLLVDQEAEKKWGFSLKESLKRSSNKKLFEGYTFLLLSTYAPETLKGAIESCGGKCLMKAPKDGDFIIVAAVENRSKCTKFLKQNVKVVLPEAILDGVLRQEINFNKHLLT